MGSISGFGDGVSGGFVQPASIAAKNRALMIVENFIAASMRQCGAVFNQSCDDSERWQSVSKLRPSELGCRLCGIPR
jgi:hypothetical protein